MYTKVFIRQKYGISFLVIIYLHNNFIYNLPNTHNFDFGIHINFGKNFAKYRPIYGQHCYIKKFSQHNNIKLTQNFKKNKIISIIIF